MKSLTENTFVFLIGYFTYSLIEILARGFTHWTMSLTGGIVLTILYAINTRLAPIPLWQKCVLGSLIITSVEFTVGILVNIIFRWNVWDYSGLPFNILGQICVPFTALWFLICIPGILICKAINYHLRAYYIIE